MNKQTQALTALDEFEASLLFYPPEGNARLAAVREALTDTGVVSWQDIAAIAQYASACRHPDIDFDEYQPALERINVALKAANLTGFTFPTGAEQ